MGTESLTAIERLLFGRFDFVNESPFVESFGFAQGSVRIELVSLPGERHRLLVEFPDSSMTSVSFQKEETIEWPLDLMHLDCYSVGSSRWRFVLNSVSLELVWESEWPSDPVYIVG